MRSRTASTVVANQTLVGAVTVLVTVVAVFLAYNANNGLPFVPTRELTVDLPDGASLVPQNEVREGGYRIGLITEMDPVRLPNGKVGARVHLKLDSDVPPVPVDSRFTVRPRSALSLKYLELDRGTSRRTVPANGHVGVAQAGRAVELDELLNTFDARTRQGEQDTLGGFSTALASRGADLNQALSRLPDFLGHLEPVSRTLADPGTRLGRLFRELGDFTRVLAPIGDRYARSFANGATTFAAIVRDPAALRDTIALTPPTLAIGERSLRAQVPYLRDLAGFSRDLEASAREIRPTLGPLNGVLALGVPVQRRSVALSARTRATLASLDQLVSDPATPAALRGLTATAATLNPQLRYLGPKITVCNAWNYFWTFNADHVSERDTTGTAERTVALQGDSQDNSVTTMGAVTAANGENVQPGGVKQYLHAQPYGRAVDPQGNADCEDGQRGYLNGPEAKALPPNKRERFSHLVLDPRTPGDQGPVYDQIVNGQGVGLGPSRVPAGETFSAEPDTGPVIP
jgi:virulence factor Mce-like protein